MNFRLKFFAVALFATCLMLLTNCTTKDIVKENVENASIQLSQLLDSSLAEGKIRIPSTYKNGKIDFVPIDDWVSGFFAGSLWYMYELTGEEKWAEAAQKHTEHLHDIQYLTYHHDVGFMVYDSYGNGRRIKNIEAYDTVLVNTANSLCTRFRPNAGILQSWDANRGWQGERGWKCPVIIDNMMNLELLFKVSEMTGNDYYKNIAISHADKTLENHYREDFSTFHVVDYDHETGEVRRKCTAQGYSDESSWARGQAWSVYGFTVAYRFTEDPKYLERAVNVADFILNYPTMPEDLVPYWDYNAPNIPDEPRDVSSASIVASALYELYWHTKEIRFKEAADKMIVSLSSPAYRAEPGTNGGFILMHSVGSIPHGSNIDVPLNYADYYFLESLLRKSKLEKGLCPIHL